MHKSFICETENLVNGALGELHKICSCDEQYIDQLEEVIRGLALFDTDLVVAEIKQYTEEGEVEEEEEEDE